MIAEVMPPRRFDEPFLSALALGGRCNSLSLLSQIAGFAAGDC